MFRGVRLRLTAWYIGVLLVITLALGVTTFVVFTRALRDEIDDSLRDAAGGLASQLHDRPLPASAPVSPEQGQPGEGRDDHEEDDDDFQFFNERSGSVFSLILSPGGDVLLNPLNVQVPGLPDVADARRAATSAEGVWGTTNAGDEYRIYSVGVRDDGRTLAVVQVGRSLEPYHNQVRDLVMGMLIAGAGGIVVAAVGGLFVAGRALVPVRQAFERQRAFVADASHELRTPLTLLRMDAETLERSRASQLSGDDREIVRHLVSESDFMARLVNDLLILARLDENRMPLDHEPVAMDELIEEAAAQGRLLAARRQLTIEASTSGALPVIGDRARLRESLLELMENAIRHTPDGGRISLEAERRDGKVVVRVSDTGPGIAPDDLPYIFERFYRADKARSREAGGTGLGLAIVRGIIEAHGGTIAAGSEPGHGATFVITLPAAPNRGDAPPA